MLMTVIRWTSRQINSCFVSLLFVILSLGLTISINAVPKPNKIDRDKNKFKKIDPPKPAFQPTKQLLTLEDCTDSQVRGQKGQWCTVEGETGTVEGTTKKVIPVHMHVLPDGKVLYWGPNLYANSQTAYQIWDPSTSTTPSQTFYVPSSFGNLYCSGHAFLPDGRLVVTGGQGNGISFTGIEKAAIFNYSTGQWAQLPDMNGKRWYPTNLTLGNGNMIVWGGVSENGGFNNIPQILEKQFDGSLAWRPLIAKNPESYNLYYSWLHLVSSGKVFAISGIMARSYLLSVGDRYQNPRLYLYPPVNPSYPIGGEGYVTDYHDAGNSVIYDKDKIFVIGGGDYPKRNAETIDLANTYIWDRTGRMLFGRRHASATLLPTGKVLVNGGNQGPGFNNNCPENFVYRAEMWDPNNRGVDSDPFGSAWTQLADARQRRLYHSTAVLLPDGRVLTGGTTAYDDKVQNGDCKDHSDNPKLEIFSPPYLFNSNGTEATRPQIGTVPAQVNYEQTLQFTVTGAGEGSKVVLIRLPSVTHSFNQNQGISNLALTISGQNFTVTMPSNRNECPPGHYMMFVVNGSGVPSVAKIIQVL